jgi:hypothetical protein
LICITGGAEEYFQGPANWPHENAWNQTPTAVVQNASRITVGGKPLGSDFKLWKVVADNSKEEVTVDVPSANHFDGGAGASKHKLIHHTRCTALTNPDPERQNLGVGEYVDFYFDPPVVMTAPETPHWDTTAGSVSPTTGSDTLFTAPINAANATVKATIRGAKLETSFDVKEPSGVKFVKVLAIHQQGYCDAGFQADVTILPTDVSFNRVEISEMEATATASGCFASLNDRIHKNWTDQGFGWLQPDCDNKLPPTVDQARVGVPFGCTGSGSFSWPIPWNFRVVGDLSDGHTFKTLPQTAVSANSSCTTSKNGISVKFQNSDQTVP